MLLTNGHGCAVSGEVTKPSSTLKHGETALSSGYGLQPLPATGNLPRNAYSTAAGALVSCGLEENGLLDLQCISQCMDMDHDALNGSHTEEGAEAQNGILQVGHVPASSCHVVLLA